jgi:hypothetical protein
MALISPVMTKVNSSAELLAEYPRHLIAVSNVFGKLFSKKPAEVWICDETFHLGDRRLYHG